ncbi:sugar ABC transporter permease, partial [bacterium]|nr:sugar ABC transporter permease [bacterium]
MNKRRNLVALLFLTPNIFGFLLFTFLPVIAALALSTFRWDIFHPPRFVGLRNFTDILGWFRAEDGALRLNDPNFWKYLYNTLFLMMGIPIHMALSLFLAIVLNQKIRGRVFFRTIFFLPNICAGVGLLLLWTYLYDPDFGLINRVLAVIGVEGPRWLTNYHRAKPAIITMSLWTTMGGLGMIIYLAGLSGIPQELYEAAEIDGAGLWAQFRHVTWPMLAPTTFFIFVTSVIAGFQGGFDAAYVMTQGGPDGATTTVSYYIYNHAFQYFNMGKAAAIAVVLFIIVFGVTLMN